MLSALAGRGAEVLLCGTCMDRCGIGAGDVVAGVERGSMDALVSWLQSSERAITF